ncbi:MAG: hypothetical protein HYU56_02580 [Candidatus Aenigmarchaeota archaeon]|nr:hypothetical protein [Candidatus Aenigmarchaeota archaeon]
MQYVDRALQILRKGGEWTLDNLNDVLRYGAVATGLIYGGKAWMDTQDAVAATNALAYPAIFFAMGETFRAFDTFKEKGTNALQWIGYTASFAIPFTAAHFLADKHYQPLLDIAPIGLWAIAQIPVELGRRKQEYRLGSEILEKGRDEGIEFLRSNTTDDELARYIGKTKKIRFE